METTLLLSRVLGIYCLVMGAAMLRRGQMMNIFREVARQRALSFMMGALMLLIGLTITTLHAKWNSALEKTISLLGFGILAESCVFLFSSKEFAAWYVNTLENKITYYVITAGYFILGAYLSCNGFVLQK